MDNEKIAKGLPSALFHFWHETDFWLDKQALDKVHNAQAIYERAKVFAAKRFPELFTPKD